MKFTDSHIHLASCKSCVSEISSAFSCDEYEAWSCAHSPDEFFLQEKIAEKLNGNPSFKIFRGFGMLPQDVHIENAVFLEKMLDEKRVDFIGETGFDFYTKELRESEMLQEEAFERCVSLALRHDVPVVIHNRKAMHKMYEHAAVLSKVRKVIFHSFSFTYREAFSLLDKGLDAYFSFGISASRGRQRACECIQKLPPERVLRETDAPYQCSLLAIRDMQAAF